MRMYDLIYRKRQGERLTKEELEHIVHGYTHGAIPDYQMAALLMAIYFKGMDIEEIIDLTLAMAASGDAMNLAPIPGIKVDKHSTGGVGDKTTLILVPLLSAAGVPVAKMSGRSLGYSGGTIDKLESIPGYATEIDEASFYSQMEKIGAALVGQTMNLCPADKKIYALRDVTATIDSTPLIASSIMSKKIAGGADAILFDVKTGAGSFMKRQEDATHLAHVLVAIGNSLGRKTTALITNMEQPLGFAVGNALEVKEAIETLRGEGPFDLVEIILHLGAHMLLLSGERQDFKEAYKTIEELLSSGKALEQWAKIIEAQRGDPRIVENVDRLPSSQLQVEYKSDGDGYVSSIDAYKVGILVRDLGAGRENYDDVIDYGVGVVLKKKVGDRVEKGEALATIHYRDREGESSYLERIGQAFVIQEDTCDELPVIFDVIKEEKPSNNE